MIERTFRTSDAPVRLALAEIKSDRANKHIGSIFMPDFRVPAEKVTFSEEATQSLNRDDTRARGAKFKEIFFKKGGPVTVAVAEHGQKIEVDDNDIEDASAIESIDLKASYAAAIRGDVEDNKEFNIAVLATDPANFAGPNKSNGPDLSIAGLRALFDGWRDQVKAGGFDITDVYFGRKAIRAIQNSPDLTSWFGAAGKQNITLETLKAFFAIPGQVVTSDYSRVLDNDATATQFWPDDSVLLVSNSNQVGTAQLSTRNFGVTAVCPYGRKGGVLTDVRVVPIPTTEEQTEIAVAQRYGAVLANAALGFLAYNVTGY